MNNKYYCTKNLKCPEKYNKLIIEQNRCIDDCNNDKSYKYEYNNSCLEECPFNTTLNKGSNKCIDNENELNRDIKTEFIQDIQDEFLNNIKENIKNGLNTTEIDKGNDTVYIQDNIIYTITSTFNQKTIKILIIYLQ